MKDRICDNTVDKELQVTLFAQIQPVNIKDEDQVLPLLNLISHHIDISGGVEGRVVAARILNLVTRWRWSSLRPGCINPGECPVAIEEGAEWVLESWRRQHILLLSEIELRFVG
jgi:hypothetical protein